MVVKTISLQQYSSKVIIYRLFCNICRDIMLKNTVKNTAGHISETPVKRAAGYSLIELMTTVLVLIIVTTIAIPNYISLLNNNRLTSQANELLAAVTLARAEAIKQNENMVFCHSTDGANCSAPPGTGWVGWLVHDTVDNTPIATGIIQSEKVVVLSSSNIASATLNSIGNSVRFSAQGLLRSGSANNPLNGVLRVCLPGAELSKNIRDIELRSGGRARVTSSSAGQSCPVPANPA
ncbi:GspH/FimT family pseudopilin [Rheinheimera baltica]|uniref:Type II secretion system protein H n=1 Tax=Rheinheimera baltica TaxID=67576 RepID=A0ABT9I0S5_9GAMM|nr:GspH/FimT family pseudopilin [Rheinheimera baltica]MDP5136982.1 GspH/FimT family pseudopilin [Rheinheimera baltica]